MRKRKERIEKPIHNDHELRAELIKNFGVEVK
jgi:hypothetical protein